MSAVPTYMRVEGDDGELRSWQARKKSEAQHLKSRGLLDDALHLAHHRLFQGGGGDRYSGKPRGPEGDRYRRPGRDGYDQGEIVIPLSAHIRQSRPDAGLGFQVKVLDFPKFFPLRSE